MDTINRQFSPFHQTTPSANPLTVGPLPLQWLGTGWLCSGQDVIVPLLPILSSFFTMPFLLLMYGLVLFCNLHFLCPRLAFMGDGRGLLGLPHFCLFLGPWVYGLPVTTFYQAGLMGLISFFSFFRVFIALCFCRYPLIFYSIPFFTCYWAVLLLGLFSFFFFFFIKMGINKELVKQSEGGLNL